MQLIKASQMDLEAMVRKIVEEKINGGLLMIPVGVSNRHVHLCRKDMDILFGEGYEMQPMKELSQKGFYSAKETVVVAGPKGAIPGVRLLGPMREHTQVELLASDKWILGLAPDIRESGTLADSPLLTIVGSKGTVLNNSGVMIAWRHIHMNSAEARLLGVNDGSYVKVQAVGNRAVIFDHVKVRLGDSFNTELHLDVDEANAAGVGNGDLVKILL